jgi:hypothetical protein
MKTYADQDAMRELMPFWLLQWRSRTKVRHLQVATSKEVQDLIHLPISEEKTGSSLMRPTEGGL